MTMVSLISRAPTAKKKNYYYSDRVALCHLSFPNMINKTLNTIISIIFAHFISHNDEFIVN